ncbi:methyl-accepting chemotaxis protein [Halodesulfovibrio spirochaetisodalis]|uniref:methyl-accepting chemotaxis protein n=1 Tax=Halodesulfovibrio spirochaetisodalis TaxID=1560234 RepID=UPI000832E797|nr:methyl-accepting chemotaxis protein [Halodesulfovibrio spirochaetisodalis]
MNRSSSISIRLNIMLIALLILTCTIITAINNYTARQSLEKQLIEEQLPAEISSVLEVVEKELLLPASHLTALSKNPFLLNWLTAGEPKSTSNNIYPMLLNLSTQLNTSGVGLASKKSGKYYSATSDTFSTRVMGKEDGWLDEFGDSREEIGINVYVNDPAFGSVAYINRRIELNNAFTGVLSTSIGLTSFVKKITAMTLGKNGVTYMADKAGLIRLHKNKEYINKRTVASFAGYGDEATRMLSQDKYHFEYTDAQGTDWYVYSNYIPELGWFLVTKADKAELFAAINNALYITLAVAAGLMLIALTISLKFVRSITGPLNKCVGYAEKIARGNLDAACPAPRKDELGRLIKSTGSMVEELKKKIAEANQQALLADKKTSEAQHALTQAEQEKQNAIAARNDSMEAATQLELVVATLSEASTTLAAQARDVSTGTDIQNRRMEETATSMEQLTATIMDVARNASGSVQSTDATRILAAEGQKLVDDVIASVNEVLTITHTMKQSLGELGKEADNIGSIMAVINDIADQTNLLALNAAIEAARAGEAGKGFAVVADEVRKLAENTMNATQEVGNVISAIQNGTRRNIAEMDTAEKAVDNSTTLAHEAGASLDSIVSAISNAADQASAIATAAEEQSAASEQISTAVEEVARISQESSDNVDNSLRTIDEVTNLSEQLQSLITRLRKE